jgi:WD40 repeat protein/tRNA A-37 threonylcarbamoyl transferase component Bud32
MPALASCPAGRTLYEFLLGQLPEEQIAAIEEHLGRCSTCLEVVTSLGAEDTLASAVRQQATLPPEPEGDVIRGLVERLEHLPAAAGKGVDSATEATRAPESEGAGPGAAHDFLAPPRGGGEIGWLGPYRVLEVLGSGGMGLVFLAEDPRLKRRVALKVMRPALAASISAQQRFLREAQAAAAIEHDHILAIHQVGEERGVPFLAMPLLRGESLDDRLRRPEKLPMTEVLRIGREVAAGLAAAHAAGLIHRDVKPSNVWLEGERGRVKILDFGLARAVSDETQLTAEGAMVGTPAYMAPEQVNGQPLDARCDLFSLGCLLYRLATGGSPFQRATVAATLLAVTTTQPQPPQDLNPGLPAALSGLVLRLLAKDPDGRPQSAQAVVEELAAIEREVATPAPRPAAAPLRKRPRRWLPVAVAALLLAVGVVVAYQIIIRIEWGKAKLEVVLGESDKGKPARSGEAADSPKPAPAAAGAPLSPLALVSRPAALAGVQSWSLETRSHRMHDVNGIGYSPDGRRLATAGEDATVRIWTADRGELVRILLGHAGRVLAVAWSPGEGKALASAGADGIVRLWEANSGKLLHSLPHSYQGRPAQVEAVAWSPDGKVLATSAPYLVHLWDAGSGKLLRSLEGHTGSVLAVCWSPDGKRLASASDDKTVRLWDADTGKLLHTLEGHTHYVKAVAWSPDGKTLASGGAEDTLRLWEADSGKSLQTFASGPISALAWSPPPGKTLALGWGGVQLWELDPAKPPQRLGSGGVVAGVAWSPDGKALACCGQNGGETQVLDIATGKPLVTITRLRDCLAQPGPAWFPDGKTLALGSHGADPLLVDADSGKLLRRLPCGEVFPTLSCGDKALAGATNHGNLWLWDTGTGRRRPSVEKAPPDVKVCALSPDGKLLAAGCADKTVRLWDVGSGKLLHTLEGHTQGVATVSWSPDGKLLASDCRDTELRLWQADSGKQLRTIPVPGSNGDWLLVLAWSPGGKMLACGQGEGRDIVLRAVDTGEDLGTLKGHEGGIVALLAGRRQEAGSLFRGPDRSALGHADAASAAATPAGHGSRHLLPGRPAPGRHVPQLHTPPVGDGNRTDAGHVAAAPRRADRPAPAHRRLGALPGDTRGGAGSRVRGPDREGPGYAQPRAVRRQGAYYNPGTGPITTPGWWSGDNDPSTTATASCWLAATCGPSGSAIFSTAPATRSWSAKITGTSTPTAATHGQALLVPWRSVRSRSTISPPPAGSICTGSAAGTPAAPTSSTRTPPSTSWPIRSPWAPTGRWGPSRAAKWSPSREPGPRAGGGQRWTAWQGGAGGLSTGRLDSAVPCVFGLATGRHLAEWLATSRLLARRWQALPAPASGCQSGPAHRRPGQRANSATCHPNLRPPPLPGGAPDRRLAWPHSRAAPNSARLRSCQAILSPCKE